MKFINESTLKINETFFPLFISNNFLNKELYNNLKSNFPNFEKLQVQSFGQTSRKNLMITEKSSNKDMLLNSLKEQSLEFYNLFQYFLSNDFKEFILQKFPFEYSQKYGLINNNIESLYVDVQLCESCDNYENPWHVDTRKRYVHMLIYFGKDHIEEGGEIGIAKHKILNSLKDYTQYPEPQNLEDFKLFPPEDNFAICILSTPNSYHRGMYLKGKRRFMYIALNFTESDNNWIQNEGWSKIKSFPEALKDEKNKVNKLISENKINKDNIKFFNK